MVPCRRSDDGGIFGVSGQRLEVARRLRIYVERRGVRKRGAAAGGKESASRTRRTTPNAGRVGSRRAASIVGMVESGWRGASPAETVSWRRRVASIAVLEPSKQQRGLRWSSQSAKSEGRREVRSTRWPGRRSTRRMARLRRKIPFAGNFTSPLESRILSPRRIRSGIPFARLGCTVKLKVDERTVVVHETNVTDAAITVGEGVAVLYGAAGPETDADIGLAFHGDEM